MFTSIREKKDYAQRMEMALREAVRLHADRFGRQAIFDHDVPRVVGDLCALSGERGRAELIKEAFRLALKSHGDKLGRQAILEDDLRAFAKDLVSVMEGLGQSPQ